jgi:hypothetical protein
MVSYELRLSGNVQDILLIGALSTLRDRPRLRTVAGAVGFLLLLCAAVAYLLHGEIFARLPVPALTGGLALLLVAILARPEFNVYIGEPPEVQERRMAEAQESDSRDPYAALDLAAKRLNEYHAINQAQARRSFRWAVFTLCSGLATIVGGIWIFYLGARPDVFLTSLTTAAGIAVSLVTFLYLHLYSRTQRRSLYYYNQLVRLQQLGLTIRLAESHEDLKDRATARNKVIQEVLDIVSSAADKDGDAVLKDAA